MSCPSAPEDTLVLYTDGVIEARDHNDVFYPFAERAAQWTTHPPEALLHHIERDLLTHTGGRLGDDVALLAIHRAPSPTPATTFSASNADTPTSAGYGFRTRSRPSYPALRGRRAFRAELPFRPGRLWTFVTQELDSGAFGQILRSKGFFTLAGHGQVTGLWSQAGSVARFEPSGARDTDSPEGQELVFIGTHLRADALHAALGDCLMADGESLPPVDPFPDWDTYGIGDTCEHEHPEPVAHV